MDGKLKEECGDERSPEKMTAFKEGMAAHGRCGKPCPVCDTAIQEIVYAANETNYCPRWQTGGKVLADRLLSRLLKDDWPKTIEEVEEQGVTKGSKRPWVVSSCRTTPLPSMLNCSIFTGLASK